MTTYRTDAGPRRGRITARVLAAIIASWATGVASAQETKLPDAAKIMDKYVEATGGKEAYKKIHNRVSKGTLEILGQGLEIKIEIISARPNLFYRLMESEALGSGEAGFDGEVAWETSQMTGPTIKEGEEKAFIERAAVFDSALEWRKLYEKVECVGMEQVDGADCYKVVLTPATGKPTTQYYDVKSGLLTKNVMTLASPMGEIELQSFPSDYRAVDGIMIPHKSKQVIPAAQQERMFTLESVKQNVDLPADKFKLPDEIRELVKDAQKQESGEKTP